MIRSGRDVVDQRGVAELFGLGYEAARKRRVWAALQPVNQPAGPIPALYDAAQAVAAAAGAPVPKLPTVDQPGDLLDAREARQWLGWSAVMWRGYVHEGRVPPCNAEPCGQPHWTRSTLQRLRTEQRPGRGWWGHHEHGGHARALGVIRAAAAAGEPITTAEIATRADVSRSTAHAALQHYRDEGTTRAPTTPATDVAGQPAPPAVRTSG